MALFPVKRLINWQWFGPRGIRVGDFNNDHQLEIAAIILITTNGVFSWMY